LVLICSECDCGHRYCCDEHSKEGRRQKHANAQADYQREHHETWKTAHKDQQKNYRDREREQAARLACTAVGVGCAVPVVAADDPQATASSSSSAPGRVVVTGSLMPQVQQKETANPVTAITFEDLTENGFVTVANAVQRSSPATAAVQGVQLVDGFAPEHKRTEECEQVVTGVTDQSLEGPATQGKVSVQAHPAKDDTRERLIEARFRHKPMCCMFCDRVLASYAGVNTRIWSG
jgi:hypothetical protein